MPGENETLAYLLDLDGEEIIYDGGYVARFTVKRIAATPEKPHGISYSLTFHAADGRRLIGYDNAHGVSSPWRQVCQAASGVRSLAP